MTRHLSEAERRDQILGAARTLFVEKGYLAARVEDVARRAGLSKGAVYFYFSSKRAVFDALVDEEYARALSILVEAEKSVAPAAMKLQQLASSYLDYFTSLQTPPRFFMLMSEMAIRDEGVREQVKAIHDRFISGLRDLVEQGVEEGLFRPVDPESVAILLKGLIDGIAGQAAAGIRPDIDKLARDGLYVLLSGLLAAPTPTTRRGDPRCP